MPAKPLEPALFNSRASLVNSIWLITSFGCGPMRFKHDQRVSSPEVAGARFALTSLCCMTPRPAQAKLDLFGDLPIVEAIREGSLDATRRHHRRSLGSRALRDGTPVIVLAVAERISRS